MAEEHHVQPGEGLSGIAEQYGFFPDTIWNDPANADLKALRKDGNVLLPGDRIHIPTLRQKSEYIATTARHRFRRLGVPAKFRLQVFKNQQPRVNQPYQLDIDGVWMTGTTDAEGFVEVSVSPQAQKGMLIVGEDEEVIKLDFGYLDPITEVRGVQQRLQNLGFYEGEPTGLHDRYSQEALRAFQGHCALPPTGERDADTIARLAEVHDDKGAYPSNDDATTDPLM